jgi:hypothetical protein
MTNISLTLNTNSFFGSILMSPIQMGSLIVNNSVTNISRLGTFKHEVIHYIIQEAEFLDAIQTKVMKSASKDYYK